MKDAAKKGRAHRPIGTKNPKAKLTECDVKEIRRIKTRGVTNIRIARMFGVSESMIEFIVKKLNWKHVGD
jgi:hypothetical protein